MCRNSGSGNQRTWVMHNPSQLVVSVQLDACSAAFGAVLARVSWVLPGRTPRPPCTRLCTVPLINLGDGSLMLSSTSCNSCLTMSWPLCLAGLCGKLRHTAFGRLRCCTEPFACMTTPAPLQLWAGASACTRALVLPKCLCARPSGQFSGKTRQIRQVAGAGPGKGSGKCSRLCCWLGVRTPMFWAIRRCFRSTHGCCARTSLWCSGGGGGQADMAAS
jgi:hypothetical protein